MGFINYRAECGCEFALIESNFDGGKYSTDGCSCGSQDCPLWAGWCEVENLLWLSGVALDACWSPGVTDLHHATLSEALAAYRHPEALRSLTAVEAASLAARVTGYWGHNADPESIFGSPGLSFEDVYKVAIHLPQREGAA